MKIDGSRTGIWVQLGHALKEAGDLEDALRSYDQAIALAPDDPDALLHAAHLLKRLGDLRAIPVFQRLFRVTWDPQVAGEIAALDHATHAEDVISADMPQRDGALEPRPRGVIFKGRSSGTSAPALRLIVDEQCTWEGEIGPSPSSASEREVKALLSFDEPLSPTEARNIAVEAISPGLTPASATICLPYASRFMTRVRSVMPVAGGVSMLLYFRDRENLTPEPWFRAEMRDGTPIASRVTSATARGGGFDCELFVSASIDALDSLALFPMWSMRAAPAYQPRSQARDLPKGEVQGVLEGCAAGVATGWISMADDPYACPQVEIRSDGHVVTSGSAEISRPEIAIALGNETAYGFEIQLPAQIALGATISACVGGTSDRLLHGRFPAPPALPTQLPPVSDKKTETPILTGKSLRIGLAVTSLDESSLAGDIFTARELAEALRQALGGNEVRLVAPDVHQRIDVRGLDAVIIMRDDFAPALFEPHDPGVRLIYWVRNWFARFLESGNWKFADDVWLSSNTEARRFREATGRDGHVLPLATNWNRFSAGRFDPELASDCCFTGSYWGVSRELLVNVEPTLLPGRFRIFGSGWDQVDQLAAFTAGPVAYERLPDVYASTRIVIDDANHVTIASGSVNSRVFDAIAAGALPVTNGKIGAEEVFRGELPVYGSAQELAALLRRYLSDEAAREAKVRRLQALVRAQHCYANRADTVKDRLDALASQD
mgnify:CR=1 FL=1